MRKLTVCLPAVRRAIRSSKAQCTGLETENRKAKPSKERVRKYREKLKNDPKYKEKLQDTKELKKIENKIYKEKLKSLRKDNPAVNSEYKEKQRKWKKDSRKRKSKAEKKLRKSEVKCPSASRKPAAVRKRAERICKTLPKESENWANAISHIIKNATPKRKSILLAHQSNNEDTESISNLLEVNKVGRPKKYLANVKRKLAYTKSPCALWKSKKSMSEYKRRQNKPLKRLSKACIFRQLWKPKLESFLEENSRTMPNKKDTILIEGNHVPKRHLLCTKLELFRMFSKAHPDFNRKFSTFKKMVPKYYKRLDMTCRRVCVCTKDYNFEQKVEALNRVSAQKSMPKLKTTPRLLSDLSVCPFDDIPRRTCVDRQCQQCGTDAVHKLYQPLVESYADLTVKYHQWESVPESYVAKDGTKKKTSRWIQTEKKVCVGDLVNDVSDSLVIYTSHLFRACYQYKMESSLMANLPLDHCVVVMDFSENISLQPQDEIESAHWTIKQVTLHPIFIVRHAANSTLDKPIIFKESLVIVSDDIKHSVDAVFAFTHQLIAHIGNNPGPCPMRVLHRFSDNCAAQYKCKDAFSHISLIEKAHDIKVVYHYSESGHGKGPSDGIGAGIKKKLENLILGGKVVNNAYQTYLALTQNPNAPMNQRVIFVPRKIIASLKPKKPKTAKTIKGTQSFHMIATHSNDPDVLTCSDLSCSCAVCICSDQQGPCFFRQFRNDRKYFHLPTGKAVSPKNLVIDIPSSSEEQLASQNERVAEQSSDVRNVLQESIVSNRRHTKQNSDELQLFETSIARKGWRIRGTTPSDGNCFFWAVSDQLDLNRMEVHTHTDLRHQLVHFIEKLPETTKAELHNFLTRDMDAYLHSMLKNGTYADHMCLQMMCKMLKCSITVVHAELADIHIDASSLPTLVLGYLPDMEHYVSLEPLPRIAPEDFVAVHFKTKRSTCLYLAKVLEDVEDEFLLKFMRATRSDGVYNWPVKDDVSWQSSEDIIGRLPAPTLMPCRGIKLMFDLSSLRPLSAYVLK